MTQKEIIRLRVINQTLDKVITNREAAVLLNLSERQVIRLKKGVKDVSYSTVHRTLTQAGLKSPKKTPQT